MGINLNPMQIIGQAVGVTANVTNTRPYSSDPRGAGFSLVGPESGYPKTWVNNTGRVLTISDKINTFQVQPGGRISQLGDPVKGKIEIISGGNNASPGAQSPANDNAQTAPAPGQTTKKSDGGSLLFLAIIAYLAFAASK